MLKPFKNRTKFDQSKSRHVWISDPHCSQNFEWDLKTKHIVRFSNITVCAGPDHLLIDLQNVRFWNVSRFQRVGCWKHLVLFYRSIIYWSSRIGPIRGRKICSKICLKIKFLPNKQLYHCREWQSSKILYAKWIFFFWTNLRLLPIELIFQTYFTPLKLQRLAFLITDWYWHNKTDNFIMGPRYEGPI